jgi:hypothetical protein
MHDCSQPKVSTLGAIMKFKACAIAALLVFGGFLPVFVSYASQSNEMDISQLVPHRDQDVRADQYTEKSTIVTSSLKLSTLRRESHTEKLSISLAEPQDTLRGLKGVMVFVEDIDTNVAEHHGCLQQGLVRCQRGEASVFRPDGSGKAVLVARPQAVDWIKARWQLKPKVRASNRPDTPVEP